MKINFEIYKKTLERMTVSEVEAFIELVVDGAIPVASSDIKEKMTTDEMLTVTRQLNENLKSLNRRNSDRMALEREMIKEVLMTMAQGVLT